ncbi:hypothetical protein CU048_10445 [Beijerinckiaceae bacterium]|nr:hypothetical protein CU048_10445 [Beijerinckiaceae bacterium]
MSRVDVMRNNHCNVRAFTRRVFYLSKTALPKRCFESPFKFEKGIARHLSKASKAAKKNFVG